MDDLRVVLNVPMTRVCMICTNHAMVSFSGHNCCIVIYCNGYISTQASKRAIDTVIEYANEQREELNLDKVMSIGNSKVIESRYTRLLSESIF